MSPKPNSSPVTTEPSYAAVIGDVIRSRDHQDRRVLQSLLLNSFSSVNSSMPAAQDLDFTIGDEFQGLYETLAQALNAVLLVRLLLALDEIKVRFGIGWGTVPIRDAGRSPFGQDGPAWWNAREALSMVNRREAKQGWPRDSLTVFKSDDRHHDVLVNAFLLCQDALLSKMDTKDLRLVLGLRDGKSQKELAKECDISQSAVAQRLQSHGIYALLRAHEAILESNL